LRVAFAVPVNLPPGEVFAKGQNTVRRTTVARSRLVLHAVALFVPVHSVKVPPPVLYTYGS